MTAQGSLFNAPATRERIGALLERLRVDGTHRVLDVGCGQGEMLQMLAEMSGCTGVGVDPDGDELAVARKRMPSRGQLVWHEASIADCDVGTGFDAAICIGATHAFGPPGRAFVLTLERMSRYMKEGGRLLVGEGYWKREPPAAYLDATPFERGHLAGHRENESLGQASGWSLLHSEVSSLAEWDHFESSFLRDAEARLAETPDDSAAIRELARRRSWNEAYRRWGRDTLGFGFYVFQRGASTGSRSAASRPTSDPPRFGTPP